MHGRGLNSWHPRFLTRFRAQLDHIRYIGPASHRGLGLGHASPAQLCEAIRLGRGAFRILDGGSSFGIVAVPHLGKTRGARKCMGACRPAEMSTEGPAFSAKPGSVAYRCVSLSLGPRIHRCFCVWHAGLQTEAILIVGAHGAPLLVSAPCSHPLCWCLLGFGLVGGLGMQVDTAANLSKIVPQSRGMRCFEVLGGRFVSMHVPWQPRYMRGGAEEVTPLFCRRPNGNASQGLRCFRMVWGSQRCCLVCGKARLCR